MRKGLPAFLCCLALCLPAAAQTASQIKSSPDFLWAEGRGASDSSADAAALDALLVRLAASDILDVDPACRLAVWRTYLPALKECSSPVEVSSGICLRYIAWDDIPSIFADRWRKARELTASAEGALARGTDDVARTYCRWAEIYLASLPPGEAALRERVARLSRRLGSGNASAVRMRNIESETSAILAALRLPQGESTSRKASAQADAAGQGASVRADAAGQEKSKGGSAGQGASAWAERSAAASSDVRGGAPEARSGAEFADVRGGAPEARPDHAASTLSAVPTLGAPFVATVDAPRLNAPLYIASSLSGQAGSPAVSQPTANRSGSAPGPANAARMQPQRPSGAGWKVLAVAEIGRVPAFGVQAAWIPGRVGGYVSARSNFRFTDPAYACLSDGSTDFGFIWVSGRARGERLAGSAGAVVRLSDALALYAGAGYGREQLLWEDSSGRWARVTDLSFHGALAEAGLMCSFRRITLSAGVSTLAFSQASAQIGLGLSF